MCMVTGGDIPFKEDYDTKHVTVAGEEHNKEEKRENILFQSLPVSDQK